MKPGWDWELCREESWHPVKPVGSLQFSREKYYVYGVVEPESGTTFPRNFSLRHWVLSGISKWFSGAYPEDLHIIQLDNGSFHTTPTESPENIILLFQPAHCPELNPIERLWEHLKDCLAWQLFNNLDALKVTVRNILNSWSTKTWKIWPVGIIFFMLYL